ncbi:MAG: UDP-N-acetylmuramoyl-tripeptide--D-alanyl-D-alanine ligase [Rickettsiales bacterium]|jgi:UDP-N-acetylmuramoyl-tripeptide--D-alanyl-D-alanine ligase|nr:UDP-N-acetylmuramoyl-tripeptide--D-alanyl-D-alanine ligase [Rickettsiales bacterium]
MSWTSKEAVLATKGEAFSDWQGENIVFDSRLIKKGDIFLALPGGASDGHDYVKSALEKGASGAIVSRVPEMVNKEKLLLVSDCLKALSDMALYKRKKSNAKFIAVTGSVGKTSTKELLGLALSAHGKTFISRGNYNNFLGVPINLASLSDDAEYAVIEMGMDHKGEITPLSNLTKPDIAIITAIEKIHIANFDSIEGIAEAKAEIFTGMNKEGIAIINSLSNCHELLKKKAAPHGAISLGVESKVSNYQVKNNATKAELNILDKEITLNIDNILGIHQINNMAMALSCVASLNLDPAKSIPYLEKFQLPRGRGLVSKISVNDKNITLIDDSYNAGPVSVKAALKNLSYYNGRRVVILGDMVDMGDEALKLHLDLKQDIIDNKIDKVICFGKMMSNLYETLPEDKKLGKYLTLKELALELPDKLANGDVLLIKGSFYLTKLYWFTQHLMDGTLDIIIGEK